MALSDGTRRSIRSTLQVTVALAASLPLLVHTAGLPDALPGLGAVLAAAAAVTRLMALPQVDQWLPEWLRKAPARAELPPHTGTDQTPAS